MSPINAKFVLLGQFGVVYRARLTGWDKRSVDGIVAVKTLKGYRYIFLLVN